MRNTLIGFLVVFCMAALLIPEAKAAEESSLSSLVQEAVKNSPRLRAARYKAEAAKARVSFFKNVPDPMVEYEYDKITTSEIAMNGAKVRPMKSWSVSQEIPFPTKIFMRKKSAQKEADSFQREYEETQRKVIKEVKEAYFNLYLNQRKAAYARESLKLQQQTVDVATSRYSTGRGSQQDVFRAQVEYAKMSNSVLLYEKEIKVAQSLLASLLGRDVQVIEIAGLDAAQDLQLTEKQVEERARNGRPELRSVKAMLERAQVESSLSKQDFLPDIAVKYAREEKDGRFGRFDENAWSGSVGFNVPLWFWSKQASGVREARANLEAAKAEYESVENFAVYEARSAFAQYGAARQMVVTYETGIIPQAVSAAVTARRGYEAGMVSFKDLLEAQRLLNDLQMEYFEAVASLQVAIADLELSIGQNIEDVKGEGL